MRFNPGVLDIWAFRRVDGEVRFLLLHTSQLKADRHFNGGRFWQVPSGVFDGEEPVPTAVDRVLGNLGLRADGVWAAEHVYTIYNRRFHEIEVISVFAAEVLADDPTLDPEEHSTSAWLPLEEALSRVHYRGLKDGLRSVHEFITGVEQPAAELCLRRPGTGSS